MTPEEPAVTRSAVAPEATAHEAAAANASPGPSPGASLSLRGVSKRYADQVAVDGVSLEVAAGEFVTLLGPSGSGKTTTLNMIAGFVELDAGDILLDGRPIADLPPYKRNVGMVFQSYALFPHMSAFDNVAFPLRQRGVGKGEVRQRVMSALEMTGMTEFTGRRPRQLSGGQQQRIALARAIVFNPRVLLMDEPLGALDKKLRQTLQLEIKRIHRELGITFIYVTHDQEEALVLSDRIGVFDRGRIVQLGSATELYERPTNVFVADFVGESNMLTGTLVRQQDGYAVDAPASQFRVADAAGAAPGQEVTVVVRPERVVLVEPDAPPGDRLNAIPGTVVESIYLGDNRRYVIQPDRGPRLVAQIQLGGGGPVHAAGERVLVTWPIDAGIVLPHDHEA